jgi:hypothetical protein
VAVALKAIGGPSFRIEYWASEHFCTDSRACLVAKDATKVSPKQDTVMKEADLFRQYAKEAQIVLLTFLRECLQATVLQLPATAVGSKAPQRAAYV